MISKRRFIDLVKQDMVVSVRVVPVPFEDCWCIDTIIRTPMEAGSHAETVTANADTSAKKKLTRFSTIDGAAEYLKSVGITTFTVDMSDAVTHIYSDPQVVRLIQTSARLWDDDADEHTANDVAS